MEGIISIFHIDAKLLIAQFINFAIVFAVLYWFGLRKLGAYMKERSEKIKQGLSSADESKKILAQTEEASAAALAESRKEAKTILDKAHDDAQKYAAKSKALTDSEIAASLARATKEVEAKKSEILSQSKQSIISLAANMTRKTFAELGVSESSEVAKSAIAKIETGK